MVLEVDVTPRKGLLPKLLVPLTFAPFLVLFGSIQNVPPAKTGAPGDGKCSECHTGTPDNPGTVLLDFGKLTYTPGVGETIQVHIYTSRTPGLTGFQLTARLASNELQQAGHFEAAGVVNVQVKDGIEYVNHSAASSNDTYVFTWTPPATNVGDIKFYVAAVAGEANGHPDANVYTAIYTLPAATRDLRPGYRWQTFDVPGAIGTSANGISSNGLITGTYRLSDNHSRGFLRNENGTITTFQIPGADDTLPNSVNSAGTIVGSYFINSTEHNFIRTADGAITTFDIPGAVPTLSQINDSGVITGYFTDGAGSTHALTITNPTTFQFFDVFKNTTATGINNLGYVIGAFGLGAAFVRSPDSTIAGITMCQGNYRGTTFFLRMNDAREIVGYCVVGIVGGMSGRASLIGAENGAFLRRNYFGGNPVTFNDINNSGQIVGAYGADYVITHGLILTPCEAKPATTNVTIPAGGGNISIGIISPQNDCLANALNGDTWVSTSYPDQKPGTVQYTFGANPAGAPKTFNLWVAGSTVAATQEGAPCDFTFAGNVSVTYQGGSNVVGITGPQGCPWNPHTDSDWISFPASGGSGTGTLTFHFTTNPDTSVRSGTITIGTQSLVVLQSGAPSCSFAVSPLAGSLPATGGAFGVTVTTGPHCGWSASNDNPWITLPPMAQGMGSGSAVFMIAPNPQFTQRMGAVTVAGQNVTITQLGSASSPSPLRFVSLPPCRVMETRPVYNFEGRTGAFGPPFLAAGEVRTMNLPVSTVCQIPATARAYVLNVTLVPRGGVNYVTVWPAGDTRPSYYSVRSPDGNIVANSAIVKAGVSGGISVYTTDATDAIIDIAGYFTDDPNVPALVYYPLTPCRVIDTRIDYRTPPGPFGPPSMGVRETRHFRFPSTPYCQIPIGAAAYSMTVTAVPQGPLQYLTAWPTGGPQPNVSSLNSPAGRTLANSVIIPANMDGSVDVFTYNQTDFLVDINGYFAADDGKTGLYYFPVTQCRAVDTTNAAYVTGYGGPMFADDTTRSFAVPTSPYCTGIPATAKGYALNVTAVPNGSPMPFLTVYPTGKSRPNASILNAFEGQTVSNSVVVPAGSNGAVDVYAYRKTHVVVEVSGYFGR
ncbi:MAG: hypothetical protein IT167_25120 [Bryobacterales bacterium]|nr:hypothetical protein [Bryobacterales bacterium]